MVSDRSSQADFLTNLCEISMRIFFDTKKGGQIIIWSRKTLFFSYDQMKLYEIVFLTTYFGVAEWIACAKHKILCFQKKILKHKNLLGAEPSMPREREQERERCTHLRRE